MMLITTLAGIDAVNLEIILIPLKNPDTLPLLYLVDMGGDQQICCRNDQLFHMGMLYTDIPVVFEITGEVTRYQTPTTDAEELFDDQPGTPAIAVDTFLIGPCRGNEAMWQCSVDCIRQMMTWFSDSDVTMLIPVDKNTPELHLMQVFWCLRCHVGPAVPCAVSELI
jgi:hypothetical protein